MPGGEPQCHPWNDIVYLQVTHTSRLCHHDEYHHRYRVRVSICLRSDDLTRDRYLSTITRLTEHDRPTFVDFRRVREALASVLANSAHNATLVVMFGSSSGGVAAFNIARWLLDTFGQVRFYGKKITSELHARKDPRLKSTPGVGMETPALDCDNALSFSLSLPLVGTRSVSVIWVRECVCTVPS